MPDFELVIPGRFAPLRLEALHTRAARAAPERAFHAIDAFGVPFDDRFHSPVGQVADEPVHSFELRLLHGEPPEADSLYAAADHEAPGD